MGKRGRKPIPIEDQQEYVRSVVPSVVAMIEEGIGISDALDKLGIKIYAFYKYLTVEQHGLIRMAKVANTRKELHINIKKSAPTEKTFHDFIVSKINEDTAKPLIIIKKRDRINYLLGGMCRFYDIPLPELLHRARTQRRYRRKAIAVKLLRDIADCSLKDIMYEFGNNSEQNIWEIHRRISDELSDKVNGDKEIQREYNELLTYLNL